jgi:epoxyqueuosine reductase
VNRKTAPGGEPAFRQRHDFAAPQLLPLLELSDEEFRERFRGSPIKRAKRVGLQRNVCIALGNIGDPAAVPALVGSLRVADAIVREHAAWALGRIGGAEAERALASALAEEEDGTVRSEIEQSLDGAAAGAA